MGKTKFQNQTVNLITVFTFMIACFALTVITMMAESISAKAAVPSLSSTRYIKTYPLSTGNNTYVYMTNSLNKRGTSTPKKAYNAVIYATDEIYVYTMTDTYAYISYPVSSGRRYGYIKINDITSNNYSQDAKTSKAKITTYQRAGSTKYGYIDSGDTVYAVAVSGSYTQVIYNCGNLYKMGWISTDNYNRYINTSNNASNNTSTISTQISAEQAKAVMFNAVYYANSYSDLKAAFGYDSAQLYNHYITYGIKEGRSASPVFDPVYYLNNNADLKKVYGSDYTSAYNHWILYGCSEGRASSKYYNGAYYKNKYSDLQNAYFSSGSAANSYYQLALHYLNYGINEKRWANANGYLPGGMSAASNSGSSSGSGVIRSTGTAGVNLIKSYESCRLTAYKAVSTETYYTIGWGHYGSDVKKGMTITQAEADRLFLQDIKKYEGYLNAFLQKYNISVTQAQYDALASFTYNLGNQWEATASFKLKTILINGANRYTAQEIRTAFTNWNKSGGKVLPGLTNRRNAEANLFING